MSLTAAERRLRWLLRVLVFAFVLAVLIYELGPLVGPFRAFFRQLPFVSNSVVKVSVMAMLCLYAWGDVRRRIGLVAEQDPRRDAAGPPEGVQHTAPIPMDGR